jgi:hypothetical protein
VGEHIVSSLKVRVRIGNTFYYPRKLGLRLANTFFTLINFWLRLVNRLSYLRKYLDFIKESWGLG